MSHIYKATDKFNGLEFWDVNLAEVTKKVRKLVKLDHGNRIRTALLEEGSYHCEGSGRTKRTRYNFYSFEFTIVRY